MTLRAHDLQMFKRLGIFENLLERAKVDHISASEAEIDFGIATAGEAGIIFPYYSLENGEPSRRVTARIRLDNPPRDELGKLKRYKAPYGDTRHLYFAPCEPAWVDNRETPVLIVEAGKSALSALAWCERHDRRFIPVALGGCWNFHGRIGKTTTPDGERVDEKGPLPDLKIAAGRRVYVAYDSNCLSNDSVFAAREKLIEELLNMKSDVRVIDLPPSPGVNGVDDFIGLQGDAAFFDLFESAVKRSSSTTGSHEIFDSYEEFEKTAPLSCLIENFQQKESATGIAGLPGNGKTWLMLSIVKANLTGPPGKLWGVFPALERVERVVYLIPESGRTSFKHRLELMGLYDYVRTGRLMVRTLSKGPAPDLGDARILHAAKGAVVMLDSAIRWVKGEENSASDNQRGLAADVFRLLEAEALSVFSAYHSPKSFGKDDVMTLENALRGSGDLGAMLSTCWAVKQLSREQNTIHIENVKARDFQPCGPFQLVGRPFIDKDGDFAMYKKPGECGALADEQEPVRDKGGASADAREAKVANKELMRQWITVTPLITSQQVSQRFSALGIKLGDSAIRKYRKELGL